MGLDVSHDCWHGAGSVFHTWRNALVRAAGYETEYCTFDLGISMAGDANVEKNWLELECPKLDPTSFEEKNVFGEWDKCPDDPLLIILVHSDCKA